jgi:hypothetical protein
MLTGNAETSVLNFRLEWWEGCKKRKRGEKMEGGGTERKRRNFVTEEVMRGSKEKVLKAFNFLKREQVSKVNMKNLGQR